MIWFTSDTHFEHKNIIDYCKRPFNDIREMEECIIQNLQVIKSKDILVHLGDVGWNSYNWDNWLSKTPTKQVFLLYGNHDSEKQINTYKSRFVAVDYAKTFRWKEVKFFGCHYAHRIWPGKGSGSIHLYGHSHGSLPGVNRSMDVGVDTNNFKPYSAEEIIERFKNVKPYEDIKET